MPPAPEPWARAAVRAPAPPGAGRDPAPRDPAPLGEPGPCWRPSLARGVLVRSDPVRGADLLVMPERVVVLSGGAGGIVRLCDGRRTVEDIVDDLSRRFRGARVAADVRAFLDRLRTEGWLR